MNTEIMLDYKRKVTSKDLYVFIALVSESILISLK